MPSPLDLASAPLKLGLTVAGGALDAGVGLVRSAYGALRRGGEGSDGRGEWERYAAAPQSAPTAAPAPEPAPTPEQHVDEEPVLVAEVAEEGVQDGAGAELKIEPPWEGYEQMRAQDVQRELRGAGREVLAAVDLYERTHKARRSVLDAAERRLRELSR